MENQELRLARVKKSCKVASIAVKVMFNIALAASVILLVALVILIVNAGYINEQIINSGLAKDTSNALNIDNNQVTSDISANVSVKLAGIDWHFDKMQMTSDVPVLKNYFDEHDYGYAYGIILQVIYGLFSTIVITVLMGIFRKMFKIILDSESPFDAQVLKYLKIAFIVFSVLVGVTVSAAIGVVLGLIFICVYNIFLYGKELQTLSDETL